MTVDQCKEPGIEAPCQKCCNHHHGKELPMWCFAVNTTLFLLFLMLAVIHLNWLVQQRPERPICSFLPLRHNVRCHSARGPQLGSPVTDDRYLRSLLPWNLFTKLQSFPLYCIFAWKFGGTKGTGKWKKQKFSNSWDSSVVCACFWEAMMIIREAIV